LSFRKAFGSVLYHVKLSIKAFFDGGLKMPDKDTEHTKGFVLTLATFIFWGFLPIYWKLLEGIPAFEIICHRIVWAVVFLAVIITIRKQWSVIFSTARDIPTMKLLVVTGLTVGCNWLIYIWAVTSGRILEASLGYYINPLVVVLFGFFFFQERPRKIQWLAISIAAAGVLFRVIRYGNVPIASLGIAISFATYGMLRKKASVDSIPGLFIETAMLSIPALGFLLFLGSNGTGSFGPSVPLISLLLAGTGIATSVPLITFVYGARRIKLITVGILQYIAPTITFFLGVFIYHEPFESTRLVTFVCIWFALLIYTLESVVHERVRQRDLRGLKKKRTEV